MGRTAVFRHSVGLIGSIADWFAVTALFDKPLGFPYHTELLYRNRTQIIDSITKIISEKLLQPNMWQDKLYQISFMDKFIGWLRSPSGREKFRALLYEVAQRAYNHAQKGSTQESIADHIRQYLKRQPLVSFFQDRLISLLEDPNSHMFNDAVGLGRELVRSDDFDALLDKLIQQWMEESKHSTVSIITINKFIGVVDTRKIAKDIKKGIISWLDQWEQAEGEQREWLCRKFELFLYSMNGQLAYGVQNWQDQFVDSLPIEKWLSATQRSAKDYFTQGDKGKEELKDLAGRTIPALCRILQRSSGNQRLAGRTDPPGLQRHPGTRALAHRRSRPRRADGLRQEKVQRLPGKQGRRRFGLDSHQRRSRRWYDRLCRIRLPAAHLRASSCFMRGLFL